MQVIQEYICKITSIRDCQIARIIALIWLALHLKSRRTFLSCYHFFVTRLLEQTRYSLENLSIEELDVVITHALKLRASRNSVHQDKTDPLTEAVNQVADQVDTRLEPGLKRLRDATLERH
jgi:hypothetical protein